jgi:hypothetical protein
MWGTFSDERTGLSFTIAAGPRQRNHSRVRVPRVLSQFRDSPNLEGQVPVFISPRNRVVPNLRHWVPFSSSPTTRRATVEVFEPASTRAWLIQVKVTLRLVVYRQSVHVGAKPLEDHVQRIWQLNPCCHSPYETPSLTRRWGSLMNMLGVSSSVRIAYIACYWKFFLLQYTQVLCQQRFCRADHVYVTYSTLQRHLNHLNGLKLDHSQV